MGHGCSHGNLFYFNNEHIVINTTKFNKNNKIRPINQVVEVPKQVQVF